MNSLNPSQETRHNTQSKTAVPTVSGTLHSREPLEGSTDARNAVQFFCFKVWATYLFRRSYTSEFLDFLAEKKFVASGLLQTESARAYYNST